MTSAKVKIFQINKIICSLIDYSEQTEKLLENMNDILAQLESLTVELGEDVVSEHVAHIHKIRNAIGFFSEGQLSNQLHIAKDKLKMEDKFPDHFWAE